jgi:hypothetical protein
MRNDYILDIGVYKSISIGLAILALNIVQYRRYDILFNIIVETSIIHCPACYDMYCFVRFD